MIPLILWILSDPLDPLWSCRIPYEPPDPSDKNAIPYDHAAAKVRIAVVEIVGVMQLVVFGRCKEPVPNTRAHGQVGMGNPPVAKT